MPVECWLPIPRVSLLVETENAAPRRPQACSVAALLAFRCEETVVSLCRRRQIGQRLRATLWFTDFGVCSRCSASPAGSVALDINPTGVTGHVSHFPSFFHVPKPDPRDKNLGKICVCRRWGA
jgi:hypothetical protein